MVAPRIEFRAKDHTYWHDGKQLTSVTTAVKELVPPFDRDTVAKVCAARDRITVDEVLAEWEAKAKASRDRGTDVHGYIESVLDGKADPILDAMNARLPEMDAFDAAWQAFRDRLNAKVVIKETIVGDPELGIAGRVDVILDVTPKGEPTRRCLMDWKTGARFETQGKFGNMLPPFESEGQCELAQYSLQLSTYRLLLERMEPDTKYGDSYLIHLRSDRTFRIHAATDYRERVLHWLQSRPRTA